MTGREFEKKGTRCTQPLRSEKQSHDMRLLVSRAAGAPSALLVRAPALPAHPSPANRPPIACPPQAKRLDELEKMYKEEQVGRKRLFNLMEDMKGKIR